MGHVTKMNCRETQIFSKLRCNEILDFFLPQSVECLFGYLPLWGFLTIVVFKVANLRNMGIGNKSSHKWKFKRFCL